MQTNYAFKTETQRGEMLIRRGKRLRTNGKNRRGASVLMHLDSSFRLELRMSKGRGQKVSLFIVAPNPNGAQLIVDEQGVNQVKTESSGVCRLTPMSGFGRVDASNPFYRSIFIKDLYEPHS